MQLLSIDVEEWFHVENLSGSIQRDSWDIRESRIEQNIQKILSILNEKNIKATFFIIGLIAKKYPFLVKEIYTQGHEIASHSYSHFSTYKLNEKALYDDIKYSKLILEDIISDKIYGYRAPNFSISNKLIDILQDLNFLYDSSLMNTNLNKRYGKLTKFNVESKDFFHLGKNLYEIPLSTINLFGQNIPWAGGFLFRFIPYDIFKKGINSILHKNNFYNFYIHTWEFDFTQPKIKNLSLNYKVRHYYNLDKTDLRFSRLLNDFHFSTFKSFIQNIQI